MRSNKFRLTTAHYCTLLHTLSQLEQGHSYTHLTATLTLAKASSGMGCACCLALACQRHSN